MNTVNIKIKTAHAIHAMGLLIMTTGTAFGDSSSRETVHYETAPALHQSALPENVIEHHRQVLALLSTVINVLQVTREISCHSEEETKLANQICDDIKHNFEEYKQIDITKAPETAVRKNHAIACMLRTVVQIYGISSSELDVAKGITAQEETDCIICELQKCLAQRNITPIHKKVRSLSNTLEPYRHMLMFAALPIAGFAAYTTLALLRSKYITVTAGSQKGPGGTKAAEASWDMFAKTALIPLGALAYKPTKAVLEDAFEKITDYAKKLAALVRGLPFKGSNPASTSKIALKSVPTPRYAREHMQAVAHMVLNQEEVFLQGGGTGMKTMLIHGDIALAQLLASGLAHEITRLAKDNKVDLVCPVATIHVSQLATDEDALKKALEKIVRYNKACVIVLNELDWKVDDGAYSSTVAQIVNGLKTVTKLHENYVVVGTARNLDDVNPALKSGSVFGTKLGIYTAGNEDLIAACFDRAHEVYGITVTDPQVRASLTDYLGRTSFTDFMNLFAAAYTKALPQIASCPLSEEGVARELTLAYVS